MSVGTQVTVGRALGEIIREPLVDTEILLANQVYQNVVFFAKPQGQPMNDGTIKTAAHTSLTQANQLGEPNQHLLLGFQVARVQETGPDVTNGGAVAAFERDFRSRGLLEFGLSGKVLYQIPLSEIPQGLGQHAAYAESTTVAATTLSRWAVSYGTPLANNYYTVGVPELALSLWRAGERARALRGYCVIGSSVPIICRLIFSPGNTPPVTGLVIPANQNYIIQVRLVGVRFKSI